MIGNSDDETNFPHKLLLTNRQITNLRKAFANYLSADIKLSKTQISKISQCGWVFRETFRSITKNRLSLLKSLIKALGMLGLTAAASATDAAINKKIFGSGTTTLIISNDDMQDILKIVKSLEHSGVLLEGISETIKNEVKKQRGGFFGALLGTFGASLLGDILFSRKDKGAIRASEGVIRAGYESNRSSFKKF